MHKLPISQNCTKSHRKSNNFRFHWTWHRSNSCVWHSKAKQTESTADVTSTVHLSHDRKPCCRLLTAKQCFFFVFTYPMKIIALYFYLPQDRSKDILLSGLRPLFHWEVTRLAARPCAFPYPSSLGLTSLAPSCFSDVLPSNSARATQRKNDTNQYIYVHNYILYNIHFFNLYLTLTRFQCYAYWIDNILVYVTLVDYIMFFV